MKNTILKKVREGRDNPIDVEVGDAKQNDFFPQVKIKRFDNEFNFSMRYKQRDAGIGEYKDDGEKIVWNNGRDEVHIYEIDNGYELEAVFNEKPESNIVEFSIQSKGVELIYQPELTDNEIAAGFERPDHIIGSYAVYMKERKKTYKGGKIYGSGKIGHIYRPKIVDSEGNWVWGNLQFNEKYGIISVIIPEEFVNSAVYPIKVDPTFGYDSAGGSNAVAGSAAGGIGNLYNTLTAITGDVVDSIKFYARKANGDETVETGIYTVSGGELSTKTGSSGSVNVNSTSAQWWSTTVSISLSDGVEYCPAYGGWGGGVGNENTRIYYDTGAPSGTGSMATTTTLPATWNESGNFNFYFSLYATFTRLPIDIDYTYTIFIDKANP